MRPAFTNFHPAITTLASTRWDHAFDFLRTVTRDLLPDFCLPDNVPLGRKESCEYVRTVVERLYAQKNRAQADSRWHGYC